MIKVSCQECQDRAAEFALGVLEGRERCETLAHLQRCSRCQHNVAALATSAGRILELLPETDPSPDFTDRVLAALPLPSARRDPPPPRFRAPLPPPVVPP